MEHLLPEVMLDRPINVHVIGCGGTGSQVVSGLARLHVTMRELGHPHGLQVTVWDDDSIEEHNVGRQLFFRPDVGMNKAEVMVYRLNMAYGLNWQANGCRFEGNSSSSSGIIIGCVDTKSSRKTILSAVERSNLCYWLDLGNRSGDGQAVLGLGGSGALLWSSIFGHIDKLCVCLLALVSGGRQVAQGGVQADVVVEADDVVGNILGRFGVVGVILLPDSFHLQVKEETLHHGIVPTIALAAHASLQTMAGQ